MLQIVITIFCLLYSTVLVFKENVQSFIKMDKNILKNGKCKVLAKFSALFSRKGTSLLK